MTRTISLIIGIATVALTVAVPTAFAEGRLAGSQDQQAVAPDWFERAAIATQRNSQAYVDAADRVVEPQSLVALRLRSEGLNRINGLGEFATSSSYVDAHERAVPPVSNTPVSVTPTGSGRDIEWPQLGIGFGIGIALVLGLILAMRTTRGRELAH